MNFPYKRPVTWKIFPHNGMGIPILSIRSLCWEGSLDCTTIPLQFSLTCVFIFCRQRAGSCLNIKAVFPGMRMCIIKIRRSWDCLIFIIVISILPWRHLYIETPPEAAASWSHIGKSMQKTWTLTMIHWGLNNIGQHFQIQLHKNICIAIGMSLKFVTRGQIDDKSVLV